MYIEATNENYSAKWAYLSNIIKKTGFGLSTGLKEGQKTHCSSFQFL